MTKEQNVKENRVLLDDTYEIHLKSYKISDFDKTHKSNTIWVDTKTFEVLFSLFYLIKNEMSPLSSTELAKDNSIRVSSFLSNNFLGEFKEEGDLEQKLKEHLESLKDISSFYLLKEVNFLLRILREHKIEFYEAVLNEYKKDKEYHHEFLDSILSTDEYYESQT